MSEVSVVWKWISVSRMCPFILMSAILAVWICRHWSSVHLRPTRMLVQSSPQLSEKATVAHCEGFSSYSYLPTQWHFSHTQCRSVFRDLRRVFLVMNLIKFRIFFLHSIKLSILFIILTGFVLVLSHELNWA